MFKDKEISRSCFYYEMFMERANGTYEPGIPGCHANRMKHLMKAEKEKVVSVVSVGYYEKQLIGIKGDMEEAMDNYMAKSEVPKYIIDQLKLYKDQVVWAVSSDELMKIIYKTIDLTVSVPIEMK